jgi:hypothetical protein
MYRVSRDKPHRKRSEEMKEKYPVLIGHSAKTCKKLFTMEQVADFICEQGLYGEVTIETPEGLMLIFTYGIYLDKVTVKGKAEAQSPRITTTERRNHNEKHT